MGNKKKSKPALRNPFIHPENRYNFELFYKALSQSVRGLCLCQVMPEERLAIFGFFNGNPLSERIHVLDMAQPLCGPMELQKAILNVHEKQGGKKNIFFIYNFESCIYLSKTTAREFFQRLNLIRDFFMGFNATFVFFVTESSLKKMIRDALDFYDWVKFTFIFVPESKDSMVQVMETKKDEEVKYTDIRQKIQYLKDSIAKTANEREKALRLNELAILYHQSGDYDSALEKQLEALQINEKANEPISIATDYNNIGLIYKEKGDLDKALEFSLKALAINEKNNALVSMAKNYNNIGTIHQAKGDLNKALAFSRKALAIFEKNNELVSQAICYNNIGQIHQAKGDLDKALEFSFKALEIDEKNNDLVSIARDYHNIGQIHQTKGDPDRALEFSFKALEIDEKNNDLVSIASNYNNIGQIYKAKGDLEKALEFSFKALEIVEKNNDRDKMDLVCSNIGHIYMAKGDPKNADKYFKRAEERIFFEVAP